MTHTIDFLSHYRNQAGGAIDPYLSYRYLPSQRGNGFFGRLIKGTIWPLVQSVLPYAKRKALQGVSDIVTGAQAGESFGEASKKALKKVGGEMFSDATRDIMGRLQGGSGIRKRKRRGKPAKRKQRVSRKPRVRKRRRSAKRRKTPVLFP